MGALVVFFMNAFVFCLSQFLDAGPVMVVDENAPLANPEEMGAYTEGDMVDAPQNRNGLVDERKRWPGGVVPFKIDPKSGPEFQNTILRAMGMFHQYTCVKFRPKTVQDRDYLYIQNTDSGCWSNVGKIGGLQILNLQQPGCTFKIGTPVHELMHALGFVHEQNRWERDEYVTINWSNIKFGMETNFKKHRDHEVFGHNVTYDYDSVMHYSRYAFSRNNQPTIDPKIDGHKIGQRDGFSRGDIQKINAMYGCDTGGDLRKHDDFNLISFLTDLF